jgi:hypothetical protein
VSFLQPAQAAKPPKELCLDFDSFSDVQMLAIKKQGKVKGFSANTTMYNIAGSWDTFLVVAGTGYFIPGTNTFHASFTGTGNVSTDPVIAGTELIYDLTTETGTVYFIGQFGSGTTVVGTDTVTTVDCSGFDPGISSGGNYSLSKDK